MKIHELIELRKLQLTVRPASTNPHMERADEMDHWRCYIRNDAGARIRITFSQGRGHHGAQPGLPEILDCLASDAAGVVNARDFADWCSEYGYDADSRRAYRTYQACQRTCDQLKRLMGANYEDLLFNVERL